MSLYGSGRAEGIGAAVAIVAVVGAVYALGSWQAMPLAVIDWPTLATAAAAPALGGLLCYRFLRAMGRSRYAGFLIGAMYALSPWFLGAAAMPREQFAAAIAPFALEGALRLGRPNQRAVWLAALPFCLAAPWLAGPTLVALFATLLAIAFVVDARRHTERDECRGFTTRAAVGGLLAAVIVATLLWLDPLASTLHTALAPTPAQVLAAHRPSQLGLDLAALLRLPGPVMLLFALLGLLRRQRHAPPTLWLFVGCIGALPATIATLAVTEGGAAAIPPMLQSTSFWACLLACTALGAAGLDDFLELPLRRSGALPWLLVGSALAAPLVPLVGSHAPAMEWPLVATFLAMPLLLPLWRRFGVLRFKNVLAAAGLAALLAPALQILPNATAPHAAPLAEGSAAARSAASLATDWARLAEHPSWHYVGLALSLASASLWLLSASLRKWIASKKPATPHRAMAKKATPAKRS